MQQLLTVRSRVPASALRSGLLLALASVLSVAALLLLSESAASADVCVSGQVCHYTEFNWDHDSAHIRHHGNNDNWNTQFPVMNNNDWSVRNLGESGMSVETKTSIWGLGSRAYCVRQAIQANLHASGGQGRSHFWTWDTDGCL